MKKRVDSSQEEDRLLARIAELNEYFAQFDANGNLDLDPTKTFVANLPFLSGNVAQTITFDDTTFKNQFTAEERTQIEDLVVNQKKWGLSW